MALIRFYGQPESLAKWRELVAGIVGKQGSEMHEDNGRKYYEVELSDEERGQLQEKLWHTESGTGETATGRPYLWNDCISFIEMPGKCHCGSPAKYKVNATGAHVCQQHKPDGFVCRRLVTPK